MAGLSMDIKLETRLCEVNGEFGQVYGIVEFSGEVRKVDPSKIRFKDETNEQCRSFNDEKTSENL